MNFLLGSENSHGAASPTLSRRESFPPPTFLSYLCTTNVMAWHAFHGKGREEGEKDPLLFLSLGIILPPPSSLPCVPVQIPSVRAKNMSGFSPGLSKSWREGEARKAWLELSSILTSFLSSQTSGKHGSGSCGSSLTLLRLY